MIDVAVEKALAAVGTVEEAASAAVKAGWKGTKGIEVLPYWAPCVAVASNVEMTPIEACSRPAGGTESVTEN